jgi:hypothetical protein
MSHLRARCQDMFSRFSVGGVCNVLTVNPTTLRSSPKRHLISADAAVASLAFWATRTYLPLYEVFGAVTFRSLASRRVLTVGLLVAESCEGARLHVGAARNAICSRWLVGPDPFILLAIVAAAPPARNFAPTMHVIGIFSICR